MQASALAPCGPSPFGVCDGRGAADGEGAVDCRQIDRLLEANLEGRLSGFERMTLRQHLKTCRACRAKVDAMTAFSERVEKTLA
ncbi:MAG: zf-HC2 domain-containing protein, partial [Alphaproteobacteria bacterium]